MDYKQIVENFIEVYPDYKSDVLNFNEYLEKDWKNSLSGDAIRVLLKDIDVDFVLKSLVYNVEEVKRYKSKTKAKRYATVMAQFFNYIRKTTDIVNADLYDAISYNRLRENSYMRQMISYIENCDMLVGIVEQEPLTSSQVEKILKWTNEQLDTNSWEDTTDFKKAMAAIGIKLMMLYGITYRELRKTSSSRIPDYMGMLVEITSVTSTVKYGISQLLKAGLSDSIIKKMTGASEKLIQGCLLQ